MRLRIKPLVGVAVLLAVACGSGAGPTPSSIVDDDAITIGSFDFPESELLAELYAVALERAGFSGPLRYGTKGPARAPARAAGSEAWTRSGRMPWACLRRNSGPSL